tara:strand:+ start:288 stop:764 length:477 start_codon:yes stop_codon:yes gene_type:complete
MNNEFTKYILIISFFLISSCGFKVVDKTKGNNFLIKEINLTGDNKVNFEIRNNLSLQFGDKSENTLVLDVETNKNKTIKEKTRNNKISKFQIEISIKGNINFIERVQEREIEFKVVGDYKVSDNFSTTLSNEKDLLNTLAQEAADKILDEIRVKLNDF